MREALRKFRKGAALLTDGRFRPGMMQGVAAAIEHEAVLSPYDFRTVVDVGANRGQFTLLAAGLFPDAEIVAFEPLIEPFEKLIKVTAGLSKLRAFNVAIGPEPRSLPMNVSKRDDSSSLLPIGALQEEIFPDTGFARREEVQIRPLGDYLDPTEIRRPCLLKIDVQGYELDVLKGSEACLDHVDVVYVEASFVELYQGQPLADEVIEALTSQGFCEMGRFNLSSDRHGRAIQADFLFERR
ncbi:MAG: FkbM family methyltransferase [Pseudomonadota bacterium]